MLNRRTEDDRWKCNTTTQPDSVKTYASVLCSILPEPKPECNTVAIKSTERPNYDSEFPPLDTQPPLKYSIGDVGRRIDMIEQPNLTLHVQPGGYVFIWQSNNNWTYSLVEKVYSNESSEEGSVKIKVNEDPYQCKTLTREQLPRNLKLLCAPNNVMTSDPDPMTAPAIAPDSVSSSASAPVSALTTASAPVPASPSVPATALAPESTQASTAADTLVYTPETASNPAPATA